MGVALAEAVAGLGVGRARVKWPNDVWVDGRKLAGVLIETGGELGGPVDAVIGVGLNVQMPADWDHGIDQAWADMAGEGGETDRNRVAAGALGALIPALEQFDDHGLDAFLDRFGQLDALAGVPIDVVLPTGRVQGRALGVAGDGALRVALASGGERRFHAGEASLRRS